jgi:hypothetical protein
VGADTEETGVGEGDVDNDVVRESVLGYCCFRGVLLSLDWFLVFSKDAFLRAWPILSFAFSSPM